MEYMYQIYHEDIETLTTVHSQDPYRLDKVEALRSGQYRVVFTTTILERGFTMANLDVIVVDSHKFSSSALIQIAGRVGRKMASPTGLVMFCHQVITFKMIKARSAIVQMNKLARKRGGFMIKCLHCKGYFTEPFNAVTLFKPATLFCKQCTKLWEKVKIKDNIKRCSRCLKYLSTEEQTCLDCKYLESNYTLMDQLYCQFQYDGVMKDLIKRYKFDKDVALCEQFASMMNLPKQHYDLIIPIPSPKERDYQRTFNPIRMVLSQMRIQYKAVLTMDYREKQANLPKVIELMRVIHSMS